MLQAIVGTLVLWSIYALVIISLKLSKEDWLVLERLWARFKS
jgi:hypothetical protein